MINKLKMDIKNVKSFSSFGIWVNTKLKPCSITMIINFQIVPALKLETKTRRRSILF